MKKITFRVSDAKWGELKKEAATKGISLSLLLRRHHLNDDKATPTMAEALEDHIRECPKHPLAEALDKLRLIQKEVDRSNKDFRTDKGDLLGNLMDILEKGEPA